MANAKKCDRCGAYYTPSPEIPDMRVAYHDNDFATKYYDLCEECMHDLQSFMNGCVVDACEEIVAETK